MNSAAFLSAVKQEIARLQQIQNLLENQSANSTPDSSVNPTSGKRRGMTPEGKARVAEAQRKRWAEKKAAVEAASAPAKKQAAAPIKKSAKPVAAVQPAKKQGRAASKPAAGKTTTTAKKATVKKPAATTEPTAAKKAPVAKKYLSGQSSRIGKHAGKRMAAKPVEASVPARGHAGDTSAVEELSISTSPESVANE